MFTKGFKPVGETPSYVKMLLYGQAGAGKTRFCADAPKPAWWDYESSTETLRNSPGYLDIPVKKTREVKELISDIKDAISSVDVETIVIDSITTCHDYFLRKHVTALVNDPKKVNRTDKYTLFEADYKYATQVFTDLFGVLQDAPINVVMIGHERLVRDPDTGLVTEIFPDITPRLQQAVTRLVNVVAYMEAKPSSKGTERKLYLNRTSKIEAKNRLNIQETFLVNPSWKDIFND